MSKRGHVQEPNGRGRARVGDGPPCPINPAHGNLLSWNSPEWDYLCPHIEHSGRNANHPLGATPPTRFRFRSNEV
jgi:hypothetical protein